MYGTNHAKKTRSQLKFLVLGAAGAGKTSLLRRYFRKEFDHSRMPTLGSDFYVGKVSHPNAENNKEQLGVSIQMWDTPGKENFALKRKHVVASLSDSFFKNADAIMLVYDMTSSTSFTRLLRWYADLMDLFSKQAKSLPILIVASKLDLFQAIMPGGKRPHRRVPPRDVLGLSRKYYGNDFHYEYSASPLGLAEAAALDAAREARHNSSGKNSSKRRMEISTYLVNRDNWTSDGSYLESLLHSEDGSHPDREMVLLWCMRNSLSLYEVSAASGEGVDEAIVALVQLAVDSKTKALDDDDSKTAESILRSVAPPVVRRRNQELDFQERYAPKEEKCFAVLEPLRNFFNMFRFVKVD